MNRYENQTILYTENVSKPYYKGKYYPNIPLSESDVYVITNVGDRLDNLAYSYYGDATMWWIIAMANNNATKGALYPAPGTQLRIPTNITAVLNQYKQFNKAR
jgi:nucleoid-associated protein YgaU